MLEITLLKVTHAGQENAEKLVPYIERCHAFAPEASGLEKERAVTLEDRWEKTLRQEIEYAQTEQHFASLINSEEIEAFRVRELELLYEHKKPLFFLERYSQEDLPIFNLAHQAENIYDLFAVRALQAGDADIFLDFTKKKWEVIEQMADARDKHIAENLSSAEKAIRARYSSLRDYETIRLLMCLGRGHAPEQYVKADASLVLITEEIPEDKESLFTRIFRSRQQGNQPEAKRLLLVNGISRVHQLPREALLSKSYPELIDILQSKCL